MINSDKFYQDYSAATALKNPLKNDRFARRSLCQTISIVNTTLVFIADMCDRRVAHDEKPIAEVDVKVDEGGPRGSLSTATNCKYFRFFVASPSDKMKNRCAMVAQFKRKFLVAEPNRFARRRHCKHSLRQEWS